MAYKMIFKCTKKHAKICLNDTLSTIKMSLGDYLHYHFTSQVLSIPKFTSFLVKKRKKSKQQQKMTLPNWTEIERDD